MEEPAQLRDRVRSEELEAPTLLVGTLDVDTKCDIIQGITHDDRRRRRLGSDRSCFMGLATTLSTGSGTVLAVW
jgi:hypothetical protein